MNKTYWAKIASSKVIVMAGLAVGVASFTSSFAQKAKSGAKQSRAAQATSIGVSALVDPFIGVDGGNTFAGAALPFSLAKPGPDMVPPYSTAGYKSGAHIEGFSHTHLSGTGGGGRYGNIMISPIVGLPTLKRAGNVVNEVAKPGYYAVTLARRGGDCRTELTLTPRAGWHRYNFFSWDKRPVLDAQIMIDPSHVISRKRDSLDSRCTGATITYVSDRLVEGQASYAGGWGGQNPYTVYFSIVLDQTPASVGIWKDTVFSEGTKAVSGRSCGLYLSYKVKQQGQILSKVGISFRSLADARENREEQRGWDFDQTRLNASATWNKVLGSIKVQGGSPEQQVMFYTNLYHTFLMPHNHTGQNPLWESKAPHFWDHYCLWDVFRSVMPLHTLIAPQLQKQVVQSLLDVASHTGWMPDAWVAGAHAQQQGGTNSDVVMADAVLKGLINDRDPAVRDSIWKYLWKNVTTETDKPYVYGRQVKTANELGYLPADVKCGSSISAEVAYNDFVIGLLAKRWGKNKEADLLFRNSKRIWNLYQPDSNLIWAKDRKGHWAPGINPNFKRPDSWNGPYFYEGSPWSYTYYVPHAMATLVKKQGGATAFTNRLDRFFDEGHFELENEPLFLVPYLYNYAGRPDKTAVRVHHLLQQHYLAGRRGLPGQDDSGALSSWYVWSSMGLFPVAGQTHYLLGSPLWDSAELEVKPGTKLRITAKRTSPSHLYVQTLTLNGKAIDRAYLYHDELLKGGELVFTLGAKPSGWGTQSLPPSMAD